VQQTPIVVKGTKNEELLLLFVPITADTAKYTSTIIESMCRHTDLRLRIRDDLSLEICMNGKLH
jgi:hypothetical protein